MDKYIAVKPVRFGRDYAVGEEVPCSEIDPRAVKRLIQWGKIQRVIQPDEAPDTTPGETQQQKAP